MIVYVDLEHESLQSQNTTLWQYFAAKTLKAKYCLESIAGRPCLIIHYSQITSNLLQTLKAQAVVVGGHYTALPHYNEANLAGLRSIFQEAAYPTLGICGGYQLLAQTFGAKFGPITANPGAPDSFPNTPLPSDVPGLHANPDSGIVQREQGFMPIRLLQPHPLVAGLPPEAVVFQLHSWEIKELPVEFECLAASDLCATQAIAHKNAPLMGTQFHPEYYDDNHPAGRKILENFFKLAIC